MCYAAAFPFLVWAVLLVVGVSADRTRIPFLITESIAIFVSIRALKKKYGSYDV